MTIVMGAPDQLTPCPFCGNNELEVAFYFDATAAVFCQACNAVGPRRIDLADGVDRLRLACERWEQRQPVRPSPNSK